MTARLTVTRYDAGVVIPSLPCTVRNIYASRLFDADPDAFFTLYAKAGSIGDGHLRVHFLDAALDYLIGHPEATLSVSGHFGMSDLSNLTRKAKDSGIETAVCSVTASRAASIKHETELIFEFESIKESLESAGSLINVLPAQFWEPWFKDFFSEVILTGLKIRNEAPFFDFLREAAGFTSKPVNWSAVSKASCVSQATGRRWSEVLEKLALVDLVDPIDALGKRRVVRRRKLFWTSPGLGLWLTREDCSEPQIQVRYAENALYLALKDAAPQAVFSYALDTNYKALPIIRTLNAVRTAYFVTADDAARKQALSSARGYAKLKVIDAAYAVCLDKTEIADGHRKAPVTPLSIS